MVELHDVRSDDISTEKDHSSEEAKVDEVVGRKQKG